MSKIGIIAAMGREISPLVRGWRSASLSTSEKKFTLFECDGVIAVVSGIGCKNAELAARADGKTNVLLRYFGNFVASPNLGIAIRKLNRHNEFDP